VCRAGDKPCCTGLLCFAPPGADSGVCSTAMCLPEGVSCVAGLPCCSGHCDPTFHKCAMGCAAAGMACTVDGECCSGGCSGGVCKQQCSNAYCTVGSDCCTQTCLHGTCLPDCAPSTCNHDLCTEGGPLPKAGSPPCANADPTCVAAVCNLDPYCCCGAWDTLCISHVAGLQGGACPVCL
jgi:hypothetical protein